MIRWESLHWMDGVVDIYMPDFKMWDDRLSLRYLKAKDYPEVARHVVKEMFRQVGDLKVDEDGIAKRGLLVRHLIMPDDVCDTESIMRFLADEVSPHTYINVMAQYHPDAKVISTDKYPEIRRRITTLEYMDAVESVKTAGLYRLDKR